MYMYVLFRSSVNYQIMYCSETQGPSSMIATWTGIHKTTSAFTLLVGYIQ